MGRIANLLSALIVALLLATPAIATEPPLLFRNELEMPDTIGVGRVGDDVRKYLPELQVMADYLAEQLAPQGIKRGRPVIARDNAEMVAFLRSGIVDVVSEAPISSIRFVEEGGAEILAREHKEGVGEYRSVIFVRRNSGIGDLADLRGKRVAFANHGSTGAFLLPLAAMKAAGLSVMEVADGRAAVPPDTVGYFFTIAEKPLGAAVRSGIADAGAVNDQDWSKLEHGDPAVVDALRVIAETERVPRAFLLAGPTVKPELKQALEKTLVAMNKQESGRVVLQKYGRVARYDAIDADMSKQIARVRELYRLVQNESRQGDGRPVENRMDEVSTTDANKGEAN